MRYPALAIWLLWALTVFAGEVQAQTGAEHRMPFGLQGTELALFQATGRHYYQAKASDLNQILWTGKLTTKGRTHWIDEGILPCPFPLTMEGNAVWDSMCKQIADSERGEIARLERLGREAVERNREALGGLIK